jgi:cardiolipin synthase A/B
MARKKKPADDFTEHNKVTLVRGGKDYFDRLDEMIKKAKETIHFQTYIFDNDETGRRVAASLMRAARRGVKVYLLLDGYSSQKLRGRFIDALKKAGVRFRWFEPLLRSKHFYFGRRLHHKIVVADATWSLVAGINISNRYNDIDGNTAWLDWAVLTEGEASAKLAMICHEFWHKSRWGFQGRVKPPEMKPLHVPKEVCRVRVRRNDWVQRKNQVTQSYLHMLRRAGSHIIIMSSYFLPGHEFQLALRRAVRRGVKVSIVIAGQSDVFFSKKAEKWMYDWLFRHGISIYEYKEGILHGKLSASDGVWATIGSYNINNLSAYASIELNLEIEDATFAQNVEETVLDIMEKHCTRVTERAYAGRTTIFHRLMNWGSYNIVRFMFFLFTFYYKQRNN